MSQNDMTVVEHIEELRKRIIFVAIIFLIAVIVSFFLSQPIIKYLQHSEYVKELTMNAFKITDPFKVYMQMTFVLAIVIISPFVLYQIWAFVSPGLYEKEQKITLSYIPVSVLLFLGGIAFSYLILFPFVIDFMFRLSGNMNINAVIGINEYFQFLFQITIPFGFLFQLPVVILFLTRLGIVTPMFLGKVRKYAYFLLVVIGAFITPPDIISHLMVTFPLLLLYEISIIISKIGYRKAQRMQQELESQEQV
ncbi:twin-arginine translocase subunit TatC [Bacillus chungangensis]|uniref:Sec-independent protein translocase protein TatC n=1 Tax=Bacillus chungangensis TaxID=587633 RepID=A0ABT9WY34_9BACI|nr:twin-arginine translocase subunit TatC [Bacillus chungangensis]MDQ0178206.1 sec-independent protein translocase protein TatC [Bacillus chungangensis]